MHKSIVVFILNLFSLTAFAQSEKIEVPSGVVYNYADESVNTKSAEAIKTALTSGEATIFDKMLFCGPILWARYEQIPALQKIEAGNVTFRVPQYNDKGKVKSVDQRNGKLIQTEADFKLFWAQMVKDFEGTVYTIRKLKPAELSYYWSIISFDIDEPIHVVDNGTLRILFDLSKDSLKLVWVEQMP